MMMTGYAAPMPMDPKAQAPDPYPVLLYVGTYTDPAAIDKTNPLTMLTVNDNMRTALRAYDAQCVAAARKAGATWEEIGKAAGMAKQNAQRKWSHVG
jgi:hypothetical protein